MGTFSAMGKEEGQIYFPRCLHRYQDGILILDKTGRFQKFTRTGQYIELSAKIDSFIGNGFVIKNDEAVILCSGIVLDSKGVTICDDWVEAIKLDGRKWKRN